MLNFVFLLWSKNIFNTDNTLWKCIPFLYSYQWSISVKIFLGNFLGQIINIYLIIANSYIFNET